MMFGGRWQEMTNQYGSENQTRWKSKLVNREKRENFKRKNTKCLLPKLYRRKSTSMKKNPHTHIPLIAPPLFCNFESTAVQRMFEVNCKCWSWNIFSWLLTQMCTYHCFHCFISNKKNQHYYSQHYYEFIFSTHFLMFCFCFLEPSLSLQW